MKLAAAALLATMSLAGAPQAFADTTSPGQRLVEENCARCHAVAASGDSPFQPAPPFREIVTRYEPEALAEAFAEGIAVAHPAMPEFVFTPEQIGALIGYLNSLRPK